jgi:hypothetical protein
MAGSSHITQYLYFLCLQATYKASISYCMRSTFSQFRVVILSRPSAWIVWFLHGAQRKTHDFAVTIKTFDLSRCWNQSWTSSFRFTSSLPNSLRKFSIWRIFQAPSCKRLSHQNLPLFSHPNYVSSTFFHTSFSSVPFCVRPLSSSVRVMVS